MEKRIFRIEIALLIILVIVVTNFVLFLNQSHDNRSSDDRIEKVENLLPKGFDEAFQNDLLSDIKNFYNEKKYHDLYMLFSKYARMQFEESKIKSNFKDLISFTGNIIDYAYASHELLGEEANTKYYVVIYKTKFSKGKGRITLNIREVEKKIELLGVRLNIEDIN